MEYAATMTFSFAGDLTDIHQFPNRPIEELGTECSVVGMSATVTTKLCLNSSGTFVITAGRVIQSGKWYYFRVGQMHSTIVSGKRGEVIRVKIDFNCPLLISWAWGLGVFPADCEIPTRMGFLSRCIFSLSHNSQSRSSRTSSTVDVKVPENAPIDSPKVNDSDSQPPSWRLSLFIVAVIGAVVSPFLIFKYPKSVAPTSTAEGKVPISNEVKADTVSPPVGPVAEQKLEQQVNDFMDVVTSTPEGMATVERIENKDDALTAFQRQNGISDAIAERAIKEWVTSHNGDFDWDLGAVKRICLRLRN